MKKPSPTVAILSSVVAIQALVILYFAASRASTRSNSDGITKRYSDEQLLGAMRTESVEFRPLITRQEPNFRWCNSFPNYMTAHFHGSKQNVKCVMFRSPPDSATTFLRICSQLIREITPNRNAEVFDWFGGMFEVETFGERQWWSTVDNVEFPSRFIVDDVEFEFDERKVSGLTFWILYVHL